MPTKPEFQQRLQSIEQLLGRIEAVADPSLGAALRELLKAVMDLHGAGLERMLEVLREPASDQSAHIIERLGRDELVGSLLVLYGLHPADFGTRVAQGLEKVRSRLGPARGEVELLSIEEGTVRLGFRANGLPSDSARDLKQMIEELVYQAAPDVTALVIEDRGDTRAFVPLSMLQASTPAQSPVKKEVQ